MAYFFEQYQFSSHPTGKTIKRQSLLLVFISILPNILFRPGLLQADCTQSSYNVQHNLILNAPHIAGSISGSLSDGERIIYKVTIPQDGQLILNGSCSTISDLGLSLTAGSTSFSSTGGPGNECWGYQNYNGGYGNHSFRLCDSNTSSFSRSMYVGKQLLYINVDARGGGPEDVHGGTYTINLSFVSAISGSSETEWNDTPETADPIVNFPIRGSVGFPNKQDLISWPSDSALTHDPADWFTGQVNQSGRIAVNFARTDYLNQELFTWDRVTVTLTGELEETGATITDSSLLISQGQLELEGLAVSSQYYIRVATTDLSWWNWPWPWQFGAYTIGLEGMSATSSSMLLNIIPVITKPRE